MKQRLPALVGVGGHIIGVIVKLELNKTMTIGRSRKCSFSLRYTKAYDEMVRKHGEPTEAFRTVSGVHFEVTATNPNHVEIVNLSMNGTTIDGQVRERVVVEDLDSNEHEIRFGVMDVFILKMQEFDEEPADSDDDPKPVSAADLPGGELPERHDDEDLDDTVESDVDENAEPSEDAEAGR